MRYSEFKSSSRALYESIVLKSDIPNKEWLQDQIDYAKSKPRRNSVPYMGKLTGIFKSDLGRTALLPLSLLKDIPGENNEQQNVRTKDLEWLTNELRSNGLTNTGVPYIEVAYDGSAWVSEGNHRIMAATQLGWEYMPVEVRYFDGGELVDGPLNPSAVIDYHNKYSDNAASTKQQFTKQIEVTDAYSGQINATLYAVDDKGEVAGYVDFTVFNERVSISMIKTLEAYRRKGVGKFLIVELQKEYPDVELDWGYMTPEGAALKNSLKTTVVPSEYAEHFDRLKELKATASKIKEFLKKHENNVSSLSDATKKKIYDLWDKYNEISDEIEALERDLYHEKPTKTLIVTQ